jgi:hypothetical protein
MLKSVALLESSGFVGNSKQRSKSKAIPQHTYGGTGGEDVQLLLIFTAALDGGKWSASRPSRVLLPEKGPPVPTGQSSGWALGPKLESTN